MRLLTVTLSLLMVGCASPKQSRHAVEGTRQVQGAAVYVAKAQAAGERATQSLATGKQAVAALKRTATAGQRPHVEAMEASLAMAGREHEIMRVSLGEMVPRLDAAQAAIDKLGEKLLSAERRARDYRRLKLWLSALAGGIAGYIAFRLIPGVAGPVRYYATLGAVLGAGILAYTVL